MSLQTVAAPAAGSLPTPAGIPRFGHPPVVVASWRDRVRKALAAGARTPFYLFSPLPVVERLTTLSALQFGVPATHWYSTKTQPLAPLLRWWHDLNRPVEVVSELEFRLALDCGFSVDQILVNGPAKHHWLPQFSATGLRVSFDSLSEITALLPLAKRHRWITGLRFLTEAEFDPDHRPSPTQFGLSPAEASVALRRLRHAKIEPFFAHFHLRTNLPDPSGHLAALQEIAAFCQAERWSPSCVDVGGGLPPQFTLSRSGKTLSGGQQPDSYAPFARLLRPALRAFPNLRELWLENGRALVAGSGALAISVLDVKERRGLRQLICDGGRTQHALLSLWEQHELLTLTPRRGASVLTAIHGPTCMAFDQLARQPFPRSVRAGDVLIWFEAGAYHLPWETRFSHELAEIWWEATPGSCQKIRRR